MNFITLCPFPLLIDRRTKLTPHPAPPPLLRPYYLKSGRGNEFYSLWSCLSPLTAPPLASHLQWHAPPLSLSLIT